MTFRPERHATASVATRVVMVVVSPYPFTKVHTSPFRGVYAAAALIPSATSVPTGEVPEHAAAAAISARHVARRIEGIGRGHEGSIRRVVASSWRNIPVERRVASER
jgi:hypothetical protein